MLLKRIDSSRLVWTTIKKIWALAGRVKHFLAIMHIHTYTLYISKTSIEASL